MLEYVDSDGTQRTQLGLVGDRNVTVLKGLPLGLTTDRTEPTGFVPVWLRDAVFNVLGKKIPKDK